MGEAHSCYCKSSTTTSTSSSPFPRSPVIDDDEVSGPLLHGRSQPEQEAIILDSASGDDESSITIVDGDKKDDGNDVDMDIAEQTTTSKVTGKRDVMKKFLWKIHCAIGRALDAWLLVNDNLRKWESKMTASERRILITWWVAKGMDFIMHEDQEAM